MTQYLAAALVGLTIAFVTACGGAGPDNTSDSAGAVEVAGAVTTPTGAATAVPTPNRAPAPTAPAVVATTVAASDEPPESAADGPRPIADVELPERGFVLFPYLPPITPPDVSEVDTAGELIAADVDKLLGPTSGVDVVGVPCVGDDTDTLLYDRPDGFLDADVDAIAINEGGRSIDIAVNDDGSGTYVTAGEKLIDVEVNADGSGRYYRSYKGESFELNVNADGTGAAYEVLLRSQTETILFGGGAAELHMVRTGENSGLVDLIVNGDGSGSFSTDQNDIFAHYVLDSSGVIDYSFTVREPYDTTTLHIEADGSGTYNNTAESLTITVAADGTGVYSSAAGTIEFTTDNGILDPLLIDTLLPQPEFVASGRFPPLDTLPPLDPPCVTVIRIDSSVLFDFDSAEIRPTALPTLRTIAEALANIDRAIEIRGHTDSVGDDGYNLDLSDRRAAAVQTALNELGVANDMASVGLGEREPIASNTTPDGDDDPVGRQLNRRVEIVIPNG